MARPLVLAAGLGAVPALALGLGRFSYALILPAMTADLHWSYLEASALASANSVGYVGGAVAAAGLAARWGSRRVILCSAAFCTASLALSALTGDLGALLALRLLAGLSGGVAFVVAAGLAVKLARRQGVSTGGALGVFTAGAGVGILLSTTVASGASTDWRTSWALLALMGLVATCLVALTLRNLNTEVTGAPIARLQRAGRSRLKPLLIAYGLFGAGYIGYMTFIVALLRAEGLSTATVLAFWIALGLAAACSHVLWAPLVAQANPARGPALTIAACGVGTLVPAVATGTLASMASAILFGGSMFAVVAAVSAGARALVPAAEATAAIGLLTVSFGVGQSIGPLLGGMLSDTAGGLRLSLALAAATLLASSAWLASPRRARPFETG